PGARQRIRHGAGTSVWCGPAASDTMTGAFPSPGRGSRLRKPSRSVRPDGDGRPNYRERRDSPSERQGDVMNRSLLLTPVVLLVVLGPALAWEIRGGGTRPEDMDREIERARKKGKVVTVVAFNDRGG